MDSRSRSLFDALACYALKYRAEAESAAVMRAFLTQSRDPFSRANPDGHFTASAFILDRASRSILLIHHRALDRWLQPGGHIDAGEWPAAAADREALEETGLTELHPIGDGALLDIDSHPIPMNRNKGEDAHIHHDLRFGFWANRSGGLRVNAREAHGARWLDLDTEDLDLPITTKRKLAALLPG
jgi:8-oxo-dGTP pyrophosphatase MutT (NUDIX family)